jgi:hypothetical protein
MYKYLVHTSQETRYVSATETNRLILWENKNAFVRNYVCVTFILARVVLSLLHVSAHMGHLQVSRIQKC